MARRRAVGSNGIVMRRFDRVSPTTVPRRHRGRRPDASVHRCTDAGRRQ